MANAERLIKKAESLPSALYEDAVQYIDYLSQKAHTAYVAEKLAESEREMAKPGSKWLTEEEFWDEDDCII
jgi:23S rRNA maturation mini-RNase III